jgi:energy-coupling factor transporter ATP-binding protein EcfA2
MKDQYIRVGTTYYKKSLYPSVLGESTEILIPWSAETIRQDHGKNLLSDLEQYDGFICIPENRKEYFTKRVGAYYNTYHSISSTPVEGDISNTLNFISHIFGEQKELGLDYIQLLYLSPNQILPVLCCVSKKNNTGKSTLLKWLKKIFEHNMTFLTNNDFNSQFNSDWTSQLIVAVDETFLKNEEITEKIKYLSTTNTYKTESKGRDKREAYFFGKFILCSNKENSFIKIDKEETRFWVRKINSFEKEDVYFLQKLIKEIPAFLYFLSNRELSTENKSRMWFTAQQIKTDALDKLVRFNCNKLEVEIASCLTTILDGLDEENLQFSFADLLNFLNKFKIKQDAAEIKKIIKQQWKLEQQPNSNQYIKITVTNDLDFYQNQSKGRFYTVSKTFLSQFYDESMIDKS